ITLKKVLHEHQQAKMILCLIGPEGGFSHNEVTMARAGGCIPVSISHSTLRIETAAIAISSMILYAYSG
ncbi:MAG TPA: RsmE family RNA methyltransferase, partial [Candidatus Brocadiaceae bacterium]